MKSRKFLLTMVLLVGGSLIAFSIKLAIDTGKRQAANGKEIALLEERFKRAEKILEEEDLEHTNNKALAHILEGQYRLFVAKLDNNKSGYCALNGTTSELENALEALGRRWEYDNQGRLSKETFIYNKKVSMTTSYCYGENNSVIRTITHRADGQIQGEDFFAEGKLTITRHFMGHCMVVEDPGSWRPMSMILTFYKPDGKRYREQHWSLKEGTTQQDRLGILVEYTDTGWLLREWSFGIFVIMDEDEDNKDGTVPVQLETWGSGRLTIESLRADGSVRKRTTYTHPIPDHPSDDPERKPQVETFKGTEGGIRKVDPELMRFPTELLTR